MSPGSLSDVAAALADEKIVGWFQGRMEFGPRALGNRSILGDARSESMQQVLNLKIKYREHEKSLESALNMCNRYQVRRGAVRQPLKP